jgi:hypothetical protein
VVVKGREGFMVWHHGKRLSKHLAHPQGADMSFRFKQRKNKAAGERFAQLLNSSC